jgi:hypothetical protein
MEGVFTQDKRHTPNKTKKMRTVFQYFMREYYFGFDIYCGQEKGKQQVTEEASTARPTRLV